MGSRVARHNRTPAEIDRGLLALALNGGNSARAHEILKAHGHEVSESSLRAWKSRHSERYAEMQDLHAREIEGSLVRDMRDVAILAQRVEVAALGQALEQAEKGELKDPAGSARHAAIAKGVNVDRLLVLTDRPSVIHAQADPRATINSLFQALGIDRTIEGTAEDITERELEAG
jgi:hypothetical protein